MFLFSQRFLEGWKDNRLYCKKTFIVEFIIQLSVYFRVLGCFIEFDKCLCQAGYYKTPQAKHKFKSSCKILELKIFTFPS